MFCSQNLVKFTLILLKGYYIEHFTILFYEDSAKLCELDLVQCEVPNIYFNFIIFVMGLHISEIFSMLRGATRIDIN